MNTSQLKTKKDPVIKALEAEDAHGVTPLQFTKVEDYTTFTAEFALDKNDIVFHFFVPEGEEVSPKYWLDKFPRVLDKLAQEYWEVAYPRLMAAYTEELNSWWLRAFGFANQGDPETRSLKFLQKLDEALPEPTR